MGFTTLMHKQAAAFSRTPCRIWETPLHCGQGPCQHMTYFLLISFPILLMAALVGAWLNILPYIIVIIAIIYSATWLFG